MRNWYVRGNGALVDILQGIKRGRKIVLLEIDADERSVSDQISGPEGRVHCNKGDRCDTEVPRESEQLGSFFSGDQNGSGGQDSKSRKNPDAFLAGEPCPTEDQSGPPRDNHRGCAATR